MVDSGNPQELRERLEEVLADETFANELTQMENAEDVQAALEEKGIDLSIREILEVRDTMNKLQEKGVSPDELTEEELEEVAGGIIGIIFCAVCGAIALSSVGILMRW